ncbi:MAG: hypothetical protein A2173_11990 [Planctomycetes bacterium RBG_13_44_8b]|nr:MAG: hypothetical protein A2173_11990 [Planctomycetes bacterium RBG_13_44_8b]
MRQDFEQYLQKNSVWKSPKRLTYVMKHYFRGLILDNRSVLEIGAGSGVLSIWCALNGASEVVAIEPEFDGSTKGVHEEFKKISKNVALTNKISYLDMTFEDYLFANSSKSVDYVLMHAVINHLNESAVQKLHLPSADKEREIYKKIFRDLNSILKHDGVLLMFDVGRYNFWHDLKLKNPFTKSIEYEKHQQPRLWKSLLEETGFECIDISWSVPLKLRKFGFFLNTFLPSYLTNSSFFLRAKKVKSISAQS